MPSRTWYEAYEAVLAEAFAALQAGWTDEYKETPEAAQKRETVASWVRAEFDAMRTTVLKQVTVQRIMQD